MKLFDRHRKFIACVILTAFIPGQAWAQGITIPSGTTLNVNSGQLNVAGDVINAGTLDIGSGGVTLSASGSAIGTLNNSGTVNAVAGNINLTGNWTDTGVFNPGEGTVAFNAASGTQYESNVGIGTFWNLTHNGAGTLLVNSPTGVDNTFTNSAGTFNANSLNMTIGGTLAGNVGIGTWNNTGTFTPGTDTVTFAGGSQAVLGTTTFYNFSKVVASGNYTLSFDGSSATGQTFNNDLTLQGNSSNNLFIRSTINHTQAKINLLPAASQSIDDVDVQDSNAGTSPTQQTLVARNAQSHNSLNNTNWDFVNATITWVGGASGDTTNWNNAMNWAPQVVPAAGDTVVIPGGTTYEPVLNSDVTIGYLTIGSGPSASSASLNISTHNLTLSNDLTNAGTLVTTTGIINIAGSWTNSGTFTPGTGTVNFNASSGTQNLNSGGTSATNDAFYNVTHTTNGTVSLAGNDVLISNNFTNTPATGVFVTNNFNMTVDGNWDNTSAATFTPGTGTVTLNGGNQSVLGTTTFYDFSKSVLSGGPFTLTFDSTGGTLQTFTNNLTLVGYSNPNNLLIRSNSAGEAKIALGNSATQTINYINVLDSDATGVAGSTQEVEAFNSKDASPGATTDINWLFAILSVNVPATGTTVGVTPTIVGTANAGSSVYIRDISGHVVATTTSDANGNFRVAVGQNSLNYGTFTNQLATGANSLTPYFTSALTSPGSATNFTVTATSPPPTTQVPIITMINGVVMTTPTSNPSALQSISGSSALTIVGQGAISQPVVIDALTVQSGNTVLTQVGSGNTDSTGKFSITLATALPSATNYISITVGSSSNNTASTMYYVSLTDPFGYVYNSTTGEAIAGATVTLYSASTNQIATGVQSCNYAGVCTTANPYTTIKVNNSETDPGTGFYSFLAPSGNYYMVVSSGGYNYPSKVTATPPSGRTIGIGSKGETFTVGSAVFQLDQPMDANNMLLRITKTANKSEASVGDIVMYTVNIQNLSAVDDVTNVYLNDEIPPGFKYIKNRVLLGNAPTTEPSGQRPLIFNIGTVLAGATLVLQYQLVIGSGVTMGNYKNTATAQFTNGLVISNPAQAIVQIIPDPVFDLGSVIGKVFFDWNENGIQDPPYYDAISHETIVEKPVPNVQIVMEDGTIITTDRDGKFNIPGLLPGRHLFRVDERTLPPGAYMTTDKTVITDVTAGSISKVNFGVNIDESQTKGRDAVFFNEKLRLTQDRNRPVPRLNAALFNASANADPKTEEVVLYEGALVRQGEFRIFTNYSPFINSWHLDIIDADTKKLIRSFEGTPLNINDPIYWNGRDAQDIIIDPDHKYSYILSVVDNKNNSDDTKEKPITVRVIKDEATLKKERDETKDVLKDRADRYRNWLQAQATVTNLDHQIIPIKGETIHIDRQGTDVKSIHVMKGNQLFTDLALTKQYGLTPDELMAAGFSKTDENDNLEIILPNGDDTLDVVSAKVPSADALPLDSPGEVPQSVPTTGVPSPVMTTTPGPLEHYSRPLKVGDDYMMFVALGDAQVGYNIDRGNIEPIQDATEEPGFYHEGKGAYYLKGQILGKYLITSSYDSDRAEKALFRSLDPNVYYPVYGDQSTVNYDAADTQGALYLKVEWDKSTAILGNYAIDFNDTEFAAFSRAYYGGKIDYQSVSNNPYGDARTKIVVYHAQVQQLPSHNEYLATGGSLYFLKYRNVIQGSDVVTIQVRDQTSGLVVASQTMTNGADYELDNSQGRILFWQPVAMIAQSESIISNNLINGDPIYVVVDYQYAVSGMPTNGSQGARIAQAIGDNVVLGGTYIEDDSGGQQYSLQGTDATLHINKDTTVKAEYAQSTSQEQGSYVSTDGGITFTSLVLNNSVSGKAYGIKGDTRLFDNIGLHSYYKWIGSDFGATDTSSQQGTEKMGLAMTWDMTPVTRLTASEDIQRLLAGGNLQSSTQVGASETDTTMIQVVHTAERLKLTGQFQLVETKSVIDGVQSTTNQRGATIGGQAQYDLTDRIKFTLGQQVDVMNKDNTATTVGVTDRATDHMTLNAQDVFSSQGSALTAGMTNQINKKIDLTNSFTLTNLNTGEVDKTVSVGVEDSVNKNITTTGSLALTGSSTGSTTTTASVGAKAKLSDNTSMDMSLGKSQSSTGDQSTTIALNGTVQADQNTTLTATGQVSNGTTVSDALGIGTSSVTGVTTTSLGIQGTTKVNDNTSTNASVNFANDTTGGNTTTVGFGQNSKLDQELQAVTSNSFSFSPADGTTDSSKYSLIRNQNGQNLEGDFTQQSTNQPSNVTQSNIFGLSGDVNDKLALNGSIERGKIQNLDTSQTDRTDFTIGSGYVLKDTETAEARLKNSIKLELRLDKGIGTDSLHQYVVYDAIDGKITDNFTVNAKLDYSKTLDITNGAVAERHQEIILGTAYRPVNYDKLNLIAEYSYQDGYGGGTQQADALNTNVNTTITQVFSAEGVYDINDQWQTADKIAYRIENEQDAGFAFTQTHTWLVIHRLNYKVDKDWTLSGEIRDLGVVEAKDNKAGLLLQATRELNANTELAIGWNFTKYSDDLTDLSYSSMGPFVRMTGKFYDETPEEKARARAKWLDAKISMWAWELIRKEFAKKDSKIVLELNRMFALGHASQKAGRLEESHQIYKDIITAGQMMYNEAYNYIQGRVSFEQKLQQDDKAAREYFKGGEYVKARKIWEKVVDDASSSVVK